MRLALILFVIGIVVATAAFHRAAPVGRPAPVKAVHAADLPASVRAAPATLLDPSAPH